MAISKVRLVGFRAASMLVDFQFQFQDNEPVEVDIIEPDELLNHGTNIEIPHMVAVTKQMNLRREICDYLDSINCARFTFVHGLAKIERDAEIGAGSFVGPFSLVASKTVLGKDCMISPYAMISHKSQIGRGSIIQPSAIVAGTTKIGDFCRLNLRSTILDNVTICNDIDLGAGSMITKDICEPGFYVGIPARRRGDVHNDI